MLHFRSRNIAGVLAFVLAGGYVGSRLDEAGLIELHRLTLTSASEAFSDSGTIDDSTPHL